METKTVIDFIRDQISKHPELPDSEIVHVDIELGMLRTIIDELSR